MWLAAFARSRLIRRASIYLIWVARAATRCLVKGGIARVGAAGTAMSDVRGELRGGGVNEKRRLPLNIAIRLGVRINVGRIA